MSWSEPDCYCSEPAFVPLPDDVTDDVTDNEDDGVVVASMIRGSDPRYAALIVLDARTMEEVGRAEFRLAGPAPKPLHGYFAPEAVLRGKKDKCDTNR